MNFFTTHIYEFSRDNGLLTELSSSLYSLTSLFQVMTRVRHQCKMGWYLYERSWNDGIINFSFIFCLPFSSSSSTHFGDFMYISEGETCSCIYELLEWWNVKWWKLMKCIFFSFVYKKELCKFNLMDLQELSY